MDTECEVRGDSRVLGVGGCEGELLDELIVGAAVVMVVMEGVSDNVVVVVMVEAAGVPSEPTDPAVALEDEDEGGTAAEFTGDDDDNDLDADDLLEDGDLVTDRDDEALDVHEDDDDDDNDNDEVDNSGLVCNNCFDKAAVGFCCWGDDLVAAEGCGGDLAMDECCMDLAVGEAWWDGSVLLWGGDGDRCLLREPGLVGEEGEETRFFSGTISGDLAEALASGGGMFRTRAL